MHIVSTTVFLGIMDLIAVNLLCLTVVCVGFGSGESKFINRQIDSDARDENVVYNMQQVSLFKRFNDLGLVI